MKLTFNTWKRMVGVQLFPFWALGLFSGANSYHRIPNTLSVGIWTPKTYRSITEPHKGFLKPEMHFKRRPSFFLVSMLNFGGGSGGLGLVSGFVYPPDGTAVSSIGFRWFSKRWMEVEDRACRGDSSNDNSDTLHVWNYLDFGGYAWWTKVYDRNVV